MQASNNEFLATLHRRIHRKKSQRCTKSIIY